MRAMVLAAGLGTRLRPLTDDRPKALVQLNGRTLLEITLTRLQIFGVTDVIINAHHFADQVVDYLREHENFGLNVEVSREEHLLDTGGGLKKAAHFFDASDEPFLLHNVDVVSTIDLKKMVEFHIERKALATLAVRERKTSRYLLFDEQMLLCGRRSGEQGEVEMARPALKTQALAFSGVQVMSPRIFATMKSGPSFSIIALYMEAAAVGERIVGLRSDEYYWRDLGTTENLRAAENDLRAGAVIF